MVRRSDKLFGRTGRYGNLLHGVALLRWIRHPEPNRLKVSNAYFTISTEAGTSPWQRLLHNFNRARHIPSKWRLKPNETVF